MIALIITIVVFLLLILLVIWGHYFRSGQKGFTQVVKNRDETNVRLYHEHKAEIEKDRTKGAIDEESYQYLIAELEKSLLQDIEQNADEKKAQPVSGKALSIMWPVLLTLFIFVFSFGFYLKEGAYEELANPAAPVAAQDGQHHQGLTPEQEVMVRIQRLQEQLNEQPKNTELWYELGQTLVGAGDFKNALTAFDKVIEIEGEHADLLGAKAQATYYMNEQKIGPAVQTLIDRALALDPNDPSTNILLGMDSFINQKYQKAITHWQRVVDTNKENVNVLALQEAISEAKNRLSLTGDMSGQQAVAKETGEDASAGPQLTLNISLSVETTQALSKGEDKIVFVYAPPNDGRRMPLAAVKIKASDFPNTIVLNNSLAMSPQANLSSVETVHLYAVISKLGGVGIKSGDFTAQQLNVAVSTTDSIELVIDTLVP
jgi:cytochrome c-type biogenesis protein CcmH